MAAPQCQALHLSDETRCTAPATNANGLFCHFHSRQVYGLYKGYKRRNAALDHLAAHPPPFLAAQEAASIPLTRINFSSVSSEDELRALHDHLFERHALLDRVIRARKLHHSRFYALTLDYGHQRYLDALASQKHAVLRALERLERRTADVLYEKQKWFKWVRQLEDEEEMQRDQEKKKVKQEAQLLKRHWKELEARMRELRVREERRRQDEYLDKAWEERAKADADDADDEDWDPIEDSVEDERGNYIDLLRLFLWQETARDALKAEDQPETKPAEAEAKPEAEPVEKAADAPKSKAAKKRARQKAAKANDPPQELPKPGEVHVENRADVRRRLREGQKMERGPGWKLRGTVENPAAIEDRMPPVPDSEIDVLLSQITEVKQLLFCRLVLGHAALLPIALRSNTIDEFLADPGVTNVDLRDLCLEMEQPGLQQLRDACADLDRGYDEEDDRETDTKTTRSRGDHRYALVRPAIPRIYQTKREKALKDARQKTFGAEAGTFVDFGDIDDRGQYNIRKIRVKVCGKYIYNYPSEKAMSRGGWLQFSIIAKDCALFNAVGLCRNWDEFFELSILATYQYFPSGNWAAWVGDQMRQQVLQLAFGKGFIPYFQMELADRYTMHHQTGSRSHYGRQHQIMESRNFICACLKRNDPVSRRFIQYLVMQANAMVALVRDVKDGKILAKPPDTELWLVRQKSGLGRASRNEWNVIKSVGPAFFEDMDRQRQWHFNFKEYFDVIIWDLEPGLHFSHLYNAVQTALIKAHRFRCGLDLYKPSEHILKTITRDKETQRTRDIKPGEEGKVPSIWDDINSDTNRVKFFTDDAETAEELSDDMPREWRYSEADRLEDEILFPWEHKAGRLTELKESGEDGGENEDEELLATHGRMHDFENLGPSLKRFAYDLDTDEELGGDCDSLCESDCSGMHDGDESDVDWYSDDYDSELDDSDYDSELDGEGWEDEDGPADDDADGGRNPMSLTTTPAKDELADILEGTSPMKALLDHLQLALPASEKEEAEKFKEAAKAYGYPGASDWEELSSNVRQARPATQADFMEMCAAVIDVVIPETREKTEEASDAKALAKKPKKEKKLTKNQQKEQAMEAFRDDWAIHMDRERAACFKECWHRADLEPGAQERWTEYTRLMSAFDKWDSPGRRLRTTAQMLERARGTIKLLEDLGIEASCHRRIKRDMHRAWTLTSMFFGDAAAFFNSETGLSFKRSLLLNQEERAKHPPDVRSPHSNKTRPKEHWKEWDGVGKTKEGRRNVIEHYPEHWNLVVRPTLAHLYREGVICPSYVRTPKHQSPTKKTILHNYPILITAPNRYWPTGNGPAVSLTEPDRPGKPDVYFDWRLSIQQINLPPTLQDPFSRPPLLDHARGFAKDNPGALFTVLRVWSAPHFFPLMLGHDNRDNTSFADGVGRMWEWKFIPKDMPFSEWSMHQSARQRIEPYRDSFFGDSVVCRKDMFLVMARDRKECIRLTRAAVWAVNTRPWRLEVDPWKSWFGVGLEFLEGLEERWWI
ncbi:mfs allantoate protein [Diplodia corticola]|uniref:Mfs allantoate protein n=1 Tax=Diplodia corticola TaxID=236234 RepID=A0A1J9RN47_9PEZI|nr:mfs allantoate protein [Diplodia corticola]OJD29348.1 mfs allantoate protein [Diplodia corticola]